MLWTFLNPKIYNYFKSSFKHLKKIILKKYFMILFVCLITSWFEIGNGKKCYFQYHLNIHILSQFSTTLKKDFEKGL
jgi:hypothetical protein